MMTDEYSNELTNTSNASNDFVLEVTANDITLTEASNASYMDGQNLEIINTNELNNTLEFFSDTRKIASNSSNINRDLSAITSNAENTISKTVLNVVPGITTLFSNLQNLISDIEDTNSGLADFLDDPMNYAQDTIDETIEMHEFYR